MKELELFAELVIKEITELTNSEAKHFDTFSVMYENVEFQPEIEL